jgi:hypothetical protein
MVAVENEGKGVCGDTEVIYGLGEHVGVGFEVDG